MQPSNCLARDLSADSNVQHDNFGIHNAQGGQQGGHRGNRRQFQLMLGFAKKRSQRLRRSPVIVAPQQDANVLRFAQGRHTRVADGFAAMSRFQALLRDRNYRLSHHRWTWSRDWREQSSVYTSNGGTG